MHNNNNQDSGYIEYMSDLSQCVLAHQKNHDLGLDYGCGPSHTIEFLLPSMRLNNYDPNFYPNSDALELKYDFIVLSEVIEHLKNPLQEVLKIKKLLKNNSRLYIQTQMYNENTDFANWYYRRDPTHIVFFNKQSFEFIKKLANFKHVEFVSNKLIILQN